MEKASHREGGRERDALYHEGQSDFALSTRPDRSANNAVKAEFKFALCQHNVSENRPLARLPSPGGVAGNSADTLDLFDSVTVCVVPLTWPCHPTSVVSSAASAASQLN